MCSQIKFYHHVCGFFFFLVRLLTTFLPEIWLKLIWGFFFLLFLAIRRRLRRPTGNKLQQETAAVSDSSAAATSTAVDMETSASVNKFKVRNRVATRKSGTEASSEKHAATGKDNQDDGGYKVRGKLKMKILEANVYPIFSRSTI